MARGLNLLSARTVAAATEPGKYSDGGGLYLLVRRRGDATERLWIFRFKRGGRDASRERAISIGPLRDVSLAAARAKAAKCRAALADGKDPSATLIDAGAAPTFGAFADELMDDILSGFKNEKHKDQWRMTLSDIYCRPIRSKPVDAITTEDVLGILKPIWISKSETASRIRGRIERVLDSAKARGIRDGENPARWRGHLSLLLPKRSKLTRGHHRALHWSQMPEFMTRLRALKSVSARALEWTILTGARTVETYGARPKEVDLETKVWTVPAVRMKAGREHRVPLTGRCMEIREEVVALGSKWMFPGRPMKKHISEAAMSECLKDLKVDATVHGFRSTFRDWVEDCTSYDTNLAEAALAHIIGDKTEQAYRRGDALERRRELMAAWERYCLQGVPRPTEGKM